MKTLRNLENIFPKSYFDYIERFSIQPDIHLYSVLLPCHIFPNSCSAGCNVLHNFVHAYHPDTLYVSNLKSLDRKKCWFTICIQCVCLNVMFYMSMEIIHHYHHDFHKRNKMLRLPLSHLSPYTPTSQPFKQLPFTWLHCSPLLQLPQVWLQLRPYVNCSHSKTIITFHETLKWLNKGQNDIFGNRVKAVKRVIKGKDNL